MSIVSANKPTPTGQELSFISLLLISLNEELYGIPGGYVQEIARWRQPTPIPGTPPVLPGIINQRGFVMPVAVPHALLDLSMSSPSRATRYVILKHDDVDIALLVDGVRDLVDISAHTIEMLPSGIDPQRARLLAGIIRIDDRPIALLDVATLFALLRTGD